MIDMQKNTEQKAGHSSVWLYHFPGTRAVRARWMLEELALSHVLAHVDLGKGAHKRADYLAVHPLGKVPALQIDGTVIFESLAICLYLGDRSGQGEFSPRIDQRMQRGDYLKWMAFSTGTLEPAIIEQSRQKIARQKNIEPIHMGSALTPFENAASFVEQTLVEQPFLLGDPFSAADIMNGSLMMWANGEELLGSYPAIRNWIEKLITRPAYQRATRLDPEGQ